jgi:parallel beta-helix repeat protein
MTLSVVGAYIVSSGNSTIKCNNFNNDFVGLYITDSNNSIIYHNNFVSIDFLPPLDDSNTFWYNAVLQEGNYWSDFDEPAEGAYDNNSDGIVDTPYNISGGSNQDLYPLMYPWGTTNQAPDISHEQPGDGSTGVTRPPVNLSVVVQDFDGDLMDVFIQWKNHTREWVTLQSYRGADNGTYTFVPSGNDWIWGNTTYTWSVNVTDGTSWTNETYTFTTSGSRYDVNNNDIVNFQDAGLVWVHRTSLVPYDGLYDVNQDGKVNFQDAGLTWTHRN